MTQAQDEVLTLEELSQLLKVSETTAYTLVRSGEVPGRKVGREWRFVRSRILAWLMAAGDDMNKELNGAVGLDEQGGEYKTENGQEYVAMWLPLSRAEKAVIVEKAARDGVMLSTQVADYLRDWAKE
ncbi:helix-turn-helix domain-containing protein [Deinococcus radiophilus]|uniref:DNA-binding protein n=1 Tax=Deinococcus radiophilus TaxID=32062 RepID=A0A431VV54_9DEIO|nr:helix-turn-helix domain-containing protein [Deinococcus radiophilus]RTR27040.1 DNA-binding protein [Deinococcus radiophilus]UFA50177.1 helix-turn-helix domain-containing protein [Deinococcus radiophilus]